MSDNPHSQPNPIPFTQSGIQQQQQQPSQSINNFPSTSEFNQPLPQNQSMASINYNDQERILQDKPVGSSSFKEIAEQNNQEVNDEHEELQKINLQKNVIDQDEILRMFQEEGMKRSSNKDKEKIKKPTNISAGSNAPNLPKRTASSHSLMGKKQTQQSSRKRNTDTFSQISYPNLVPKSSSFKDIKSSSYALIASSQQIKDLVLQYKIQYRSSVFDPDWQKERYKLKEQMFEQLCIGVQEIKQRQQNQLTAGEKQVLQKITQINESTFKQRYDFGIFKYCRNIILEIDLELFIQFHQRSKQPLSKDYKTQLSRLLNNLKDPQNLQLRRKVLTRQMDAQSIKVAKQMDFWTQAKRNEVKEKEEKLLMEFSVERERSILKQGADNEREEPIGSEGLIQRKLSQVLEQNQHQTANNGVNQQNQPTNEHDISKFSISNLITYNKYLDESTLTQLDELLSESQLKRMKTRLEQDLRGQCKQRMIKKFNSMF